MGTLEKIRASAVDVHSGEFAFSAAEFREIATLVKSEAGIDLPEAKATLVYSRLAKRLRLLGVSTFAEYCELVRDDDVERNAMIAALTTNVTRFFREPHHFEHLRNSIIEPLAEKARKGRRIRLWSAACSTGQEPYSMALSVLSVLPDAPRLDVRILATDINPNVVEHGARGLYDAAALKDIPTGMHARWIQKGAGASRDMFEMTNDVRSLVTFRQLNLMNSWPMKGSFDAIFCRNVVIYFDRDTQIVIWQRLSRLLAEGGALYIGHSERVAGSASSDLHTDGITTYRNKGRPAA